jgi:O-antigen/teichoic acid export membrane protein
MQFNKIFLLQLSGMLTRAVTSVVLAVILRNVFALAYGILAGRIVLLFMSYILHPYRPRLKFNLKKACELFEFGKWLLGSSILKYFINQGDKAVVGKLIDVTSLGFYGLAYRMSMLPVEQITNIVSQIMFPTFSILQDDPGQLRKRFLETIQVLSFFSIPMAGLIFIFSNDFVRLFLGVKWLPAVPIIHIFSLLGLITSVSASTGSFFQGIGKPKIITKILLARFIIIATLIYPLTTIWGVQGSALTVLLSAVVVDPFAIYLVSKLSQNKLSVVCKSILIPFFNTLIMVLFAYTLQPFLIDAYGIPAFFTLVLMSIALYLSIAYLFEKVLDYGSLMSVKKIIQHLVIRRAM